MIANTPTMVSKPAQPLPSNDINVEHFKDDLGPVETNLSANAPLRLVIFLEILCDLSGRVPP